MTSQAVWVSDALSDPTYKKMLDNDLPQDDPEIFRASTSYNYVGRKVEERKIPKAFFPKNAHDSVGRLYDFFNVSGHYVVSAAFANVLKEFDLGETSLHPAEFMEFDRKTRVGGSYFCVNFAERKESFEPLESKSVHDANIFSHAKPAVSWFTLAGFVDGDVAVNATALSGVDLWHERKLQGCLFLSDRLASALVSKKVVGQLNLTKCRLMRPI